MKLSELLEKSAEVIRKRGHCRYKLEDDRGRVCAVGALNMVLTGDPQMWPCDHTFEDNAQNFLINNVIPDNINLVAWNNRVDRTAQEVIEAFTEGARIAKSLEMYEEEQ